MHLETFVFRIVRALLPHSLKAQLVWYFHLKTRRGNRWLPVLESLYRDRRVRARVCQSLQMATTQGFMLFPRVIRYRLMQEPDCEAGKALARIDNDEGRLPEDVEKICEYVTVNLSDIERELVSRSAKNQINRVSRSACLYPAFCFIGQLLGGRRVALIEVGCSAGFGLHWDRYSYDFGMYGCHGAKESPVIIPVKWSGADPPDLDSYPPVARRLGLDLDPLDLANREDRAWARALQDHPSRQGLFDLAADLVVKSPHVSIRGNALETLPGVLGGVPKDEIPCVYNTWTTFHLTKSQLRSYEAIARNLLRSRDAVHISLEAFKLEARVSKDGHIWRYHLADVEDSGGHAIHWKLRRPSADA